MKNLIYLGIILVCLGVAGFVIFAGGSDDSGISDISNPETTVAELLKSVNIVFKFFKLIQRNLYLFKGKTTKFSLTQEIQY